MIKSFLGLSLLIFSTCNGTMVETIQDENKENVAPHSHRHHCTKPQENLETSILNLIRTITQAHKEADITLLKKANSIFVNLDYPDQAWNEIVKKENITKWHFQKSTKDIVGGWLFFPKDTNDLWDNLYTKKRLERIDYIWSFAIAAKYRHALAEYYLAHTLDQIWWRYHGDRDNKPDFYKSLYRRAFEGFKEQSSHPDVLFIRAYDLSDCPYYAVFNKYSSYEEARDLFRQMNTPRGEYYALKLEIDHPKILTSDFIPSEQYIEANRKDLIQKLIKIGQNNYGPAYVLAYGLDEDPEDKEYHHLENAIRAGDNTAYISLARWYNEENANKAKKYYNKAIKYGINEAYVIQGKELVGDIDYSEEKLDNLYQQLVEQKLSKQEFEDIIQKAFTFFNQAGENKDLLGYYCYARLCFYLYKKDKHRMEEKELKDLYITPYFNALIQGIRLGSAECYHKLKESFPSTVKEVINQYGAPPQEDLWIALDTYK